MPRAVIVLLTFVAALAATAVAEEPAAAPAFQPGDISIGEPIALPFGNPAAATPAAVSPPAPAGAVPGSGWLGLAVAESNVPGRWRVEEVAPAGPAARAGIAVGDELRAVNGITLASREDVSQALTAIAAGQDVRVAVARADQVSDVLLRAEARPAVRPAEPGRFAQQPPVTPAPAPATALSSPAPPGQFTAGAAVGVAPTAAEWQAAPGREPAPPQGSRFAPHPAPSESAVMPAPALMPAPPAMPAPMAAPAASLPSPGPSRGRTALGVRTVPIDQATQARFNLPQPNGAYVVGVVQDLPAAKAGVPPGSVIVALGDQPVRSPLELTKLVSSGPLGRPVTVQFVLPGGESKRAAVVLQSLDAPLERALAGADDTVAAPLQPAPVPRRAERPTPDEGMIRAEIRALRTRLERLERAFAPDLRRGR